MRASIGVELDVPLWAWFVLGGVVLASVAIDLVAHRGNRDVGRRWSVVWSLVWITLALAFGGWIALQFGRRAAGDYLSAWLVEKSLSVDNLFVFLVIFSRLRIPRSEQHRVLWWGIAGAFATRAAFIAGGAALLDAWRGATYVLGGFLIFAGLKTLSEPLDGTGDGKVLAFVRRRLRVSARLHGHHFFAVEDGRRVATPLLLALIVVEISDVLFATDSIPAVFAVTREPFIVFSSNVFAILGLRALYLVLADLISALKYLRFGLGAILLLAGSKMILSRFFHVSETASLLAILGVLAVTTVASLVARRRQEPDR
ncbi:MAG: TerC/Alx family metal homeostasis membrane protein [Polyangiales bacterium]